MTIRLHSQNVLRARGCRKFDMLAYQARYNMFFKRVRCNIPIKVDNAHILFQKKEHWQTLGNQINITK